jgi:integrase
MASIQRDPRGFSKYWYACFTTATGKRRMVSTKQTDKKKAQEICDAWQRAEKLAASGEASESQIRDILNQTLRNIGLREINVLRVESVFTDFLDAKGEMTKLTLEGYQRTFKEFLDFLGPRRNAPLESITEVDIADFTKFLQKSGRTNATVNRITRSFLSAPFAKALKLGRIKFNPVLACKPLPVDAMTKDTFSASDTVRLIQAAPSTDWVGLITLAYCSGMRLQDAANFEWAGVDLQNDLLTFTERKKRKKGKTEEVACVGLHPDFKDWLLEQSTTEHQKYVFPSLASKIGSDLSARFKKIMAKAGLVGSTTKTGNGKGRDRTSLSFHSFRDGAVSATFNKAAAQEIARRVSQHKGGVIENYIHPDAENLKAAVRLIPRLKE